MLLNLSKTEDVTNANMKKLEKLVMQENTVLLNHATWCGHCQMFRADWEEFKTRSQNKVNVVEIESSALDKLRENQKLYKKVVGKDGVVYFPMIIVFIKSTGTKSSSKKIYEGNRDADSLSEYVIKKIPQATPKKVSKSKAKTPKTKKENEDHEGHDEKHTSQGQQGSQLSLYELNKQLDILLERAMRG